MTERETASIAATTGVSAEALIAQIKRDGFVRFENFFNPEIVQRAHQELETLYAQDLADRDNAGINNKKVPHYVSSAGHSALTKPSHLLLNIFGKSPTFDQMFEQFLTDPSAAAVLEAVAGKNLKLRGYNIRRMTGEYNPSPFHGEPSSLPHEWHIDSPGELCISFLFNDVPDQGNAATAFVPGSHTFPYRNVFSALLPIRACRFF